MTEILERVGMAIELASKERSYGLYDYSNYPGDRPPHVVRYEKTGASVFRSRDAAEARSVYERLCREYIASAAIEALREPTHEMTQRMGMEAIHHKFIALGSANERDEIGGVVWRIGIDVALEGHGK